MLDDSDGGMASTIIHEMVHATIWVKDSVDYNENLASFIADTAAYTFLAAKYGRGSQPYLNYRNSEKDYRMYSSHMLRGARKLDSLYSTLSEQNSISKKREIKNDFILRIINSLDTLPLLRVKKPSKRFSKRLPNNAYFMGFRHYHAKLPTFKKEFDQNFRGDLPSYIKFLSRKHPAR
jgi:predicted aminopeptidase